MKSTVTKMNLIAKGRKEFELSFEEYSKLDIEVKKEIDKNYWRFSTMRSYIFEEMDEEDKAHFANKEMVIRHSIFENI